MNPKRDDPAWAPYRSDGMGVGRAPHDYDRSPVAEYCVPVVNLTGRQLAQILNLAHLHGIEVGIALAQERLTDVIGEGRAIRDSIERGER